jgi:hypothetical protein
VKVRFQADADLNHTILLAVIRQEPAVSFRSAADASFAGLSDLDVLAVSAAAGRILVTHDIRTMPRHFADLVRSSPSPGVILVPQHLSVADAVEQLLLIWAASEPDEWVNRICSLPL